MRWAWWEFTRELGKTRKNEGSIVPRNSSKWAGWTLFDFKVGGRAASRCEAGKLDDRWTGKPYIAAL